jgi:hypothetical protein
MRTLTRYCNIFQFYFGFLHLSNALFMFLTHCALLLACRRLYVYIIWTDIAFGIGVCENLGNRLSSTLNSPLATDCHCMTARSAWITVVKQSYATFTVLHPWQAYRWMTRFSCFGFSRRLAADKNSANMYLVWGSRSRQIRSSGKCLQCGMTYFI